MTINDEIIDQTRRLARMKDAREEVEGHARVALLCIEETIGYAAMNDLWNEMRTLDHARHYLQLLVKPRTEVNPFLVPPTPVPK